MPMNARDAALLELDAIRLPGWRGGAVRGAAQKFEGDLDPRDRALAEQIRVGVIKNLLLLQHLIAHHSGRSLKSIDELVQKVLAIGLYQLRFLTRIPASAAVDEAVEQARRFGQPRATGFVNAVLRNALRNADPALPPEIELSHPPALMDRLRKLLGDEQRAIEFARHDNREPPTIVRLIPGAKAEDLVAPGIEVMPHEQPGMFVVSGAKRSTLADWAGRCVAQPQDPTSALVVDHLDVRGGEEVQNVLDRCAGLGTKTMQIAERLGTNGSVVAIDPNRARCDALLRTATERGLLTRVSAFCKSWMRDIPQPGSFHRVLVDAPCSNSGVLARRPEARYAQDDRALASLRKLQLDILIDTLPHLAPGGLLVYSTCSVWSDENEGLIASFLSSHPQVLLVEQRSVLPRFDSQDPTRYHDGGYFAVLRYRD
jgi:16S rRNA (cytosine967-C5)-methyltransferase